MTRASFFALGLAFVLAGCSSQSTGGDCVDNDSDGFTTCDGDCNDSDPLTHPGAPEVCGDAVNNSCGEVADVGCNGLGTFVSANIGDDANPGTKLLPVQTIGQAMTNAVHIGGVQTLYLGEGAYPQKVALVENVNIQGGYQCGADACSWARDIAIYESAIVDVDFEGLVANAGVTAATAIDGVTVVGIDGMPTALPGGAAITLDGGSPTIRATRILGGNITGGTGVGTDRSIGIAVRTTTDAAGATLYGNDINGGRSAGGSIGVLFEGASGATALATLTGNTIRGGEGRRSVGVAAFNTIDGTRFDHNDIIAGNSTGGASIGIEVASNLVINANRINVDRAAVGTCANTAAWCTGISSASSTATITNNLVFGPKGVRTAAIVLAELETAAGTVVVNANTLDGGGGGPVPGGARTQSAALVVQIGACQTCGLTGSVGRARNNVLVGGINETRFGILEDPAAGKAIQPEAIDHNVFWFTPMANTQDILYRQVPVQGPMVNHTSLTTLDALTSPPTSANLNADPKYDASWRQLAGSPCKDMGTSVEAPRDDFFDRTRTGAIDIGHDEAP